MFFVDFETFFMRDYLPPISGRFPLLCWDIFLSAVGAVAVGVGIPLTAVEIQQRRAGLK
jgi:hypothetical protein